MLRMMPVLFLLIAPTISQADWFWQGIKVSCTPKRLVVESYLLRNEDPTGKVVKLEDGATIFYESHDFSCNLPTHIVHGTLTTPSSAAGMCSALPGSEVMIKVDDSVLMRSQLFTNECYESLSRVTFREYEPGRLQFELCGDTGINSLSPRVKGCFEFNPDAYEALTKPLDPHPISSAVNFE